MAIKKVGPAAAVTATDVWTLPPISLGAPFGRVVGFQARNWASSAKAAGGTDALETLKLTDADGRVFYLDAADADYKTATVYKFFGQDETATGLSDIHVDATGAALSSQAGQKGAIVKSPIRATVLNAGTATDYFELYLYAEV